MSASTVMRGHFGIRRHRRRSVSGVVVAAQYIALILLALASLGLIVLMVLLSLRPGLSIYVNFWSLPSFPPYSGNYSSAMSALLHPLMRTLLVCVVSIAGILVVSVVASYGFARIAFPGRDALFSLMLAIMAIPGIILLTPHFILANRLHLIGTLWGLDVFYIAGGLPFAIFLVTTFFRTQPAEIFEAAKADGASEWQSMMRVAVPLALPILVTVSMMNFLAIYGDFIWPVLVLNKDNQTLLMALQAFNPTVGEFSSRPDFGIQSAGYVVATAPQLVIFALGMKYFVAGLTSGAVKA